MIVSAVFLFKSLKTVFMEHYICITRSVMPLYSENYHRIALIAIPKKKSYLS